MFACLYSIASPLTALVKLAEDFTPRFEVVGPLVMLDVKGLSRLIGSPQEIGEQLRRAAEGPVRIAVAPTQTAAALLALGRAGLTVVAWRTSRSARCLRCRSLSSASSIACVWRPTRFRRHPRRRRLRPALRRASEHMWDALPYFESTLDRTTELAVKAHCGSGCGGGGWKHPRDSHAAEAVKHAKSEVRSAKSEVRVRSPKSECASEALTCTYRTPHPPSALRTRLRTSHVGPHSALRTRADSARRTSHSALRTSDFGLRTARSSGSVEHSPALGREDVCRVRRVAAG